MDDSMKQAALTKAMRRLVPFLFVLYVVAYLDRVNVGFAQLQMKEDLKFGDVVYGTGAGVFFLGYFLFEVPANLLLTRVGARRWIARIMVSWGLVAIAMMFTRSPQSFYLLRFLLGLAEAGFFPGIILYMTFWFTAAERGRIVAWFMTANPVAFLVGGPISGWLLSLRHLGGLMGWQWLFLMEGIPAILLGIVVLFYLPDGPWQARWLAAEEREWLQERIRDEEKLKSIHGALSLRSAFYSFELWLYCGLYFALVVGMYGISLWLPQLVKSLSHLPDFIVGFVTAAPYLAAGIGMVLVAIHSDRTGERKLHTSISAFTGALGLILSIYLKMPLAALLAMSLATLGMWSTLGPFWSMPTGFLGKSAAAGGIAIINSVGNLGGFVGPYMVGFIKDKTHNFNGGLFFLSGSLIVGGFLALLVPVAPIVKKEG